MTEDLTGQFAGIQRAMAAPLPSPEELAASKEQDRAMAERIVKARPGIPQHHAYAVLETLRTLQRVEAAKVDGAVLERLTAERDRHAELLAEASEALCAVGKAAIAVEPALKKPYPDAPHTSPWERFVERPARRAYNLGHQIRRELNQASKESTG